MNFIRSQRHLLYSTIAVLWIVSIHAVVAQQQYPQQPIELPEFIVTGKQQVDIPGGSKQTPVRPPLLSAERLDSLNPIEKLPLPSVPPAPLPVYSRSTPNYPGYVEASIGNYLTPEIRAGYGFNADNYEIDLTGGYESSTGWTPNSEYYDVSIDALSTYVAPEQFLFFAGSTTEVDLGLGQRSYSLFADTSAPDRDVFRFDAGVRTHGEHDGLSYLGAASWSTRSITTDTADVADGGFDGQLDLRKRFDDVDLGVQVDLRLRGFGDDSYPYSMVGGLAGWRIDDLQIQGRLGAQWATSTESIDRFGAMIVAGLGWTSSPYLTATVEVSSGMRPNSVRDLLVTNPYLSDTITVDLPYDVLSLRGAIHWHPNTKLSIVANVNVRKTDRDLIWTSAGKGSFDLSYRSTTTIDLGADLRYLITSRDHLLANLVVTSSSVDDGEFTPYIAPYRALIGYQRTWTNELMTTLDLVYVGDRYTDILNKDVLSGYLDLRLRAGYAVSKQVDIFLRGTNLLGSTMELWQGYRERGIFINGGITWKF